MYANAQNSTSAHRAFGNAVEQYGDCPSVMTSIKWANHVSEFWDPVVTLHLPNIDSIAECADGLTHIFAFPDSDAQTGSTNPDAAFGSIGSSGNQSACEGDAKCIDSGSPRHVLRDQAKFDKDT